MDDLFALLDELLLDLGDTESMPMDINFDDEAHWAPIPESSGLSTDLAGLLELTDVPPGGDADIVDGIRWAAFPNPFHDGGG